MEDNPANLALVEEVIARRHDLRLISAADGNLGIEYARKYFTGGHSDGYPPARNQRH